MKIRDKAYLDFSGGLRLDVAPIILPDNAVQKAINVNFDEQGRITKRLGYKAFGQPTTYNPGIAGYHYSWSDGTSSTVLIEENNDSAAFYRIKRSPLNGAITTASTTITVDDGAQFTDPAGVATHYVEIDGDLVGYTDLDGNNLTGVTGISEAHATDSVVRQWSTTAETWAIRSTVSVSIAHLNSLAFISGNAKIYKWDNATFSNNSTNYAYVTEYRNKLYAVDLTGATMNNVHFSNADDGTTWTGTDTFYITKGGRFPIVSLKKIGNYLCIFKEMEIHTWNDYSVKLMSSQLGTFNHKTANEVNKLLYFSNPSGVFATDGDSISDNIGRPIKPYLDDFTPTYNVAETCIMNIAAGRYEDKYVLHVGNTSTKDTITDANLVYDTVNKNWTVWSGLDADSLCFNFLERFTTVVAGSNDISNSGIYLFGGSTNKQTYQFGGTTYHDNYSDISSEVIFKPFDLGLPHKKKKFVNLKVLSERPGFSLYYKIDNQENWKPLGQITKETQKLIINEQGYRITLKATETSQNKPWILNGFVFEDCLMLTD